MNSIIPLAQLFKSTGSVTGRKKLQKIVHLLQSCGGATFGVTFSLGRYGAFSIDLASQLENLTENGLLRSTPTNSGNFPTQEYTATEEFLGVLEFTQNAREEPEWASLSRELNGWQTQMLEATSTIVYLKQAGWEENALREQFKLSKPHLTHLYEDAMEKARRLLG